MFLNVIYDKRTLKYLKVAFKMTICFKQFKCNRNHVRQFTQSLTITFPNDKRKLSDNENVTYSLIWQVGPTHQIKRKTKKNIEESKSHKECINHKIQVVNKTQLSINNRQANLVPQKLENDLSPPNFMAIIPGQIAHFLSMEI